MALKARFIGIDKFRDPQVGDLTGAVRDAKALWALFADSVPTIDAELLVNQQATHEAMRTALLGTLKDATHKDDIVLAFAGHGTRDHRLVAHDTQIDTLADSTVSMEELAEAFRTSKAKSVICILDCCFSGTAPARVLENTPISRDIFLVQGFSWGNGRVLFAASGDNEPAYEHPTHRHGLLTHALIKVLCASVPGSDKLDLTVVIAEATDIVRATAASIGMYQRPVAINLTDGGIKIPVLHPGKHYHEAFPEKVGIRIGTDISEVEQFGIPTAICAAWAEKFPSGLNSLQLNAINQFRILDGNSLLVVAPTSAGKTFIGEVAGVKAIADGRKAVFLFPYKALVNEKYEDFTLLYGDKLSLRVIRCTGDHLDQTAQFINGKFDIAVLTYEMFLSLTASNPASLQRIGLLVVDEGQFIADQSRGIVVELILTRLRMARNQGISPQIILLSATIGHLNKLDAWLDIQALVTRDRPVPLEMGVLDRRGVFKYVDKDGNQKTEQLVPIYKIQLRNPPKASSQDVIVPLTQAILSDESKQEKIIIFRNRRGPAEGCAGYLATDLGLPPAPDIIAALPNTDPSSASTTLRRALQGGVAFHSSDLKPEERSIVERTFRDPNSPVRVLVATTTVAAGINTPASTVILVEHEFPWEDKQFSIAEVHNMAGRAGRLGFREIGRAILLASTPQERDFLFTKYVLGQPESISSSFRPGEIGTWILRLLTQVKELPESEIPLLLANTYGGYLVSLQNPEWHLTLQTQMAEQLRRMLEAGLLEKNQEKVRLTLLGQECGRSSLSVDSCIRLIQLLQNYKGELHSAIAFMILLQAVPEVDDVYTPLFRKGQRELAWQQQLGRTHPEMAKLLQHRADDTWQYAARAKRACILMDWITGMSTEQIENTYTQNPFAASVGLGDIRRIADSTRFHLRPAYLIASLTIPGNVPDALEMENLIKQLEVGIPAHGLDLMVLPFPLARGEYMALIAGGISTIDQFMATPVDYLAQAFGIERAGQIDVLRRSVTVK